jgi:hypothetical protein
MLVAVALLTLSMGEIDLKFQQDTLRAAGFSPDGEGALAYLKTWVPDPNRLKILRGYIKQLGDEDYDRREVASRELRAAGAVILADLKAAAEHPDPEVKRRVRELLEQLHQHSTVEVVNAACGLVRATKPKGADVSLLKFAPFVPDRECEPAFLEAMASLGLTPAIRAALDDPEPLRRRAAVCAMAAAPDAPDELLLNALKDGDRRVRFEAGKVLVLRGDRTGVPVLVDAVGKGDLATALRAEELLWRIAREQAPPLLIKSAADREPVRVAWEKWYRESGAAVDPARMREDEKVRNWVVVCDDEEIGKSPGSVKFFDFHTGEQLLAHDKLESPSDVVLLTGGRMLVAEHWGSKVTERDALGRVLWEFKTADKPVVALRLADGGTFIATYAEILEVDRMGTVRYAFRPERGMLYGAAKLPGGHILFINGSGEICEADRTGAILRSFRPEKYAEGAGYWASLEVLGPDRYLLSLSGTDRVVEVNGQGKILWEAETKTPTFATRLPDGTTLVSCVDVKNYVLFDKAGKVLQTVEVSGRPFRARRY